MSEKSRKHLVAIDAQVLVWAVLRSRQEQKDLSKRDQEMVRRAGWLIDDLEREEAQVVVPAIAVAEYLTPIAPERHRYVLGKVSARYFIAPFDVKAVSIAASLFSIGQKLRADKKGTEGNRRVLRADSNIIASAKASGATVIFSNDADLRKLAENVMIAHDLPTIPNNLWGFGPS